MRALPILSLSFIAWTSNFRMLSSLRAPSDSALLTTPIAAELTRLPLSAITFRLLLAMAVRRIALRRARPLHPAGRPGFAAVT